MKTSEEILKQNREITVSVRWLLVGFVIALGGFAIYQNLLMGVLAILILQLMVSLNDARRFNDVVIEIREGSDYV